ncbi:hypothetical protein [Citricoccus muralis]|uniref:MaoC dehydratase-like protein n=1 Tax=Citricoccus muralis TaxID=169134 RepID=A0ABY8H8H3_9MICC|nr:hypothetical protein [Citricoccus muralis]WFP16963.1 hypothetical protein P8192_02225 [Citricoccus muralis]
MSPCYFERIDAHTFQPTPHTSGAWNVTEQHIAPVFGLLTHALETDRDSRRGAGTGEEPLPITRISFDILGTLTVADPMEISCRVIRPGRAHYWARTPVELVADEPVSATGHGLTYSVLHDVEGPVGAVSQALTVRPLG